MFLLFRHACLCPISLRNSCNQEQHTPLIIFIHNRFKETGSHCCPTPPTWGIIFNHDPEAALTLSGSGQNKWHEEIKAGCSAIFSRSHILYIRTLCVQGSGRYLWDNWMYSMIVGHQSLNDFGYGDDFIFSVISLNGSKKNHESRTHTIKQNWNLPVEYGKQ